MFCEKCGTRVDDGQPFCPNCGNRLGAAPAANPVNAAQPVRAPRAALQGSIMGIPMNKLLFAGGACFLSLLGMIMSWCKPLGHSESGQHMHFTLPDVGGGWLMVITTMLATLTIAALVLYLMGKATDSKILLFSGCAAGLIFILLVIKWIAGGSLFSSLGDMLGSFLGDELSISLHLSVAGWFMFFSELGAAALSILGFLQAKKN